MQIIVLEAMYRNDTAVPVVPIQQVRIKNIKIKLMRTKIPLSKNNTG